MSGPVPRTGARALVLDPLDRLLLVHEYLSPAGSAGSQWITPGGGVEDGERLQDAVIREVAEETGLVITVFPDEQPVHETRRLWSADGVTYDQQDFFFLVRVGLDVGLRPTALTASELPLFRGFRWWSVPELRQTTQRLVPADLADVVQAAVGAGTTG